ncbi:MAG: TAT-variant-translocated molybdopterin oxidoreductase [Bacteroidota bacterium]
MENKTYWKGLAELEETPEFLHERDKEFTQELPIEEIFNSNFVQKPRARRDFLKMLGFSVTAATIAASCKIPVRQAIPYVIKPEEIVPGLANYYASTYADGSDYCSILVKTRDGRPIKIEGNSNSSVTKGGTSARAQASILSLYDKARTAFPKKSDQHIEWDAADVDIKTQLAAIKTKGGNIRILSSTILSPSTKSVIAEFGTYYGNTKHVVFEPMSNAGMLSANEKSFGKRTIPGYNFDKAKVIVSFGADFLGTWISPVEFTKQYVSNRKVSKEKAEMSRHYQFESHVSLTGSNADKRIAIKPSEQIEAVIALYNMIAGFAGKSGVTGGKVSDKASKSLNKAAAEMWANKGASLVVCGSNDTNCQTIVNAINDLLGSYGSTIDFDNALNFAQGFDKDFSDLVAEMEAGSVDALIIYNANPVYSFSNGKKFGDALKKVGLTVSFNDRKDETTALVTYHLPDHHYLESWNDAEPKAGKYSLSQPAINPIFSTRQVQDSFLKWMDATVDYNTYLKNNWEKNIYPTQSAIAGFQSFWDSCLRIGVYEKATVTPSAVAFAGDVNAAASASTGGKSEGMELVIYEPVSLGNGKYANVPWLLENPDPITKVVWDNVLMVPVPYAKENNLVDGDTVEVTANGVTLELPVVLQPGMANNTVATSVGLGREKVGRAGDGVGVNVYPFVSMNGDTMSYSNSKVTVKPTGKKYELAITQTHGTFEGRNVIQQTSLSEYKKNPKAGNESIEEYEHVNPITLYPQDQYQYPGLRWGMNIDLNSCIGCGACQVACSTENNVPVVGKDEVRRVHEMHWIRIDRYYSFAGEEKERITKESHSNAVGLGNQYDNVKDWEDIEVVHQPMLCQHCENAPCENVCPVAATNHSSEGLNQMTYNRCIGTRYCANNCPYKVRRFNWFDYTTADSFPWNTYDKSQGVAMMIDDLTRMVLNPDVTVRSRGVIEKCSFCVQKLQDAKLNAKKQDRPLLDGEARTACQSACPADAIVFGDVNNKETAVSKTREDERNYYVLAELHVKPSIGYMVKVRNNENMA